MAHPYTSSFFGTHPRMTHLHAQVYHQPRTWPFPSARSVTTGGMRTFRLRLRLCRWQ
jgi:hypothetical protein